jgi:tetratricopeptide (TPR) repeat protein
LIIKYVLFILFFLWVIKAPSAYRDSIRAKVFNSDPAISLNNEDQKAVAELVKVCKMYKVGDLRRTQAISDLALIRNQQLNFIDAESLCRTALSEHKTKPGFDAYQTELMLDLATILTEEQKLDQAAYYYTEVLNYDTKYLDKTDIHIARDENNLGLNAYLLASSKEVGDPRTELLKKSIEHYKKSLQIYRPHAASERAIAVILYNQHLALRDIGDFTAAQLAKDESDKIESKLGRAVKAP